MRRFTYVNLLMAAAANPVWAENSTVIEQLDNSSVEVHQSGENNTLKIIQSDGTQKKNDPATEDYQKKALKDIKTRPGRALDAIEKTKESTQEKESGSNRIRIYQEGNGNISVTTQEGKTNELLIKQEGKHNERIVIQNGKVVEHTTSNQ